MEKMEIKKVDYGTEDYEKTIDLRNEYFRKPQGLNIRDEDLSCDKDFSMFAGFIDGELMGTIFLAHIDDELCQIKALIVDEKYRKLGLGKDLMNFIEDYARSEGYKKAKLMGRVSVKKFYEKLGYKPISEPFDYHMTPHLYMIKDL